MNEIKQAIESEIEKLRLRIDSTTLFAFSGYVSPEYNLIAELQNNPFIDDGKQRTCGAILNTQNKVVCAKAYYDLEVARLKCEVGEYAEAFSLIADTNYTIGFVSQIVLKDKITSVANSKNVSAGRWNKTEIDALKKTAFDWYTKHGHEYKSIPLAAEEMARSVIKGRSSSTLETWIKEFR
jgi:hypothetical protein